MVSAVQEATLATDVPQNPVDSVAYALALALSNDEVRATLLEDMRDSPFEDHALHLHSYLAGNRGPALGAYLYGLLFAPIAIPCIGPLVLGIFAYSLTIGDTLSQLFFFLVYGLGFGVPLFVMGLLGQWRGAQLARWIAQRERQVQVVMGVVLVAVGAWDLATNGPALIDFLAR